MSEETNDDVTDKTKGEAYKYNTEWRKDFPWLSVDAREQLLFCTWCREAPEKIQVDSPYVVGNKI